MKREQQYYIPKFHLLRFEMLKVVLCSANRNIITVNVKSFFFIEHLRAQQVIILKLPAAPYTSNGIIII
jgi:hypothetical protein